MIPFLESSPSLPVRHLETGAKQGCLQACVFAEWLVQTADQTWKGFKHSHEIYDVPQF